MNYARPRKIFLVDDNEFQLTALADFLATGSTHEISTFGTGEACLAMLHLNPDVVVLDYNLDSVDRNAANGLSILERIKKYNPAIQVIILSSQEKYAVALQTVSKGAAHYVLKGEDAFEKVKGLINSGS
jgi:two-component system OmpR family response regulator